MRHRQGAKHSAFPLDPMKGGASHCPFHFVDGTPRYSNVELFAHVHTAIRREAGD